MLCKYAIVSIKVNRKRMIIVNIKYLVESVETAVFWNFTSIPDITPLEEQVPSSGKRSFSATPNNAVLHVNKTAERLNISVIVH